MTYKEVIFDEEINHHIFNQLYDFQQSNFRRSDQIPISPFSPRAVFPKLFKLAEHITCNKICLTTKPLGTFPQTIKNEIVLYTVLNVFTNQFL
jgi:hypothetical protein